MNIGQIRFFQTIFHKGATYGIVRLNEGVVACNNFDVTVLDAERYISILIRCSPGESTHAFLKTIRPIRPKPLIPTCAHDQWLRGEL